MNGDPFDRFLDDDPGGDVARAAKSLDILLAEIDALAPHRNKLSDGLRGDPAHAARASRHNPNNAGVICARDITHDPGHDCDIHAIARRVVLNPPRDLEYVISNGEIAKKRTGWRWEPYTGPSPHDHHAHFAVGQGPDDEPAPPYDDIDPWGIYPPTEEDDLSAQGDEIIAWLKGMNDKLDAIQKTQEHQNTRLAAVEQAIKTGG